MRTEWLKKREGEDCPTQMHYARLGTLTEEMQYVAQHEGLEAEHVRAI